MHQLHQLADEIRETFGERGFKISKAIEQDRAFSSGRRSQSSLGRDLVLDAIKAGCGRLGLDLRTVRGGAVEVVVLDEDGTYRHHRVKKATFDSVTCAFQIVGDEAMLVIEDGNDGSLYRAEQWVLGYTTDSEGVVVDIFSARVLGVTQDSVSRLVLGMPVMLGTSGDGQPPTGGFYAPDEDDLGMNDDDTGEGRGEFDAG